MGGENDDGFLEGLFGGLTDWLGDFFSGCFDLLLAPLVALFDLVKLIWSWIEGFFKFLGDLFAPLFQWLSDFFVSLWDGLTSLFVPNGNVISDAFTDINKQVSDAVGLDTSVLDSLGNVTRASTLPLDIDFTIFGYSVSIDLHFIEEIQPYTTAISSGIMAIFLFSFHTRNMIHMIRGSHPIGGDNSAGGTGGNGK